MFSDTLSLANRLDGLPLAIILAAAFMRQTGTSITQYLKYYEQSWFDLQSQSHPGGQYPQGNMIQTWMISYHEIQKRDPNAAELLMLLAHFDNRDIWYKLVESTSHSPDVPDWLRRASSSEISFKICLKPLIEFSLLQTNQEGGSYAIHPVVKDWCFHIAGGNIDSILLSELAIISIGYSVPGVSHSNYAELQRRLIPHADSVRNGPFADKMAVWEGFFGIGCLYSDHGKLKEAEEMY